MDEYISASEIGEYLFCQRSWWLRQHGLETSNPEVLEQGTVEHEVLAVQVQQVELLFVTVLLLFAAALRFVGISYGQPQMEYHPTDAARGTLPLEAPIHPDEYFYVAIPLQMVVNRDFEPHFYENPSFLINLDFFTYWLTDAVQGRTSDALVGVGQRQYAPFPLYVIGRVYSALGGLLAVAATYGAARLLGGRGSPRCVRDCSLPSRSRWCSTPITRPPAVSPPGSRRLLSGRASPA